MVKNNTKRAFNALSGDPIHYGHINIIERAADVFDEVIVGIGVNPDKNCIFTLEERTDMASKSLAHLSNVKVVSYEGLTVDYAYENCIPVIVKGVRDLRDFDYEKLLDEVNKSQKLGIDTHLLIADKNLSHISSSTTKALQKEQGFIHEYVPLYVKQCLEAKMSNQYIVGVTGEIGSGKSYVSEEFVELGKEEGIQVHNIELDHIGHQILGDLSEPAYQSVRDEIAEEFDGDVQLPNGIIDRKALGEIVFSGSEYLKTLNEILYTPLMVRLRKELRGKEGLILLNAALIAETDMTYLCNNNVILVDVDTESQIRRLKERGLSEDQIQRRLESQYCTAEKKGILAQNISEDGQGKLWIIGNSDNSNPEEITNVFENIVKELDIK